MFYLSNYFALEKFEALLFYHILAYPCFSCFIEMVTGYKSKTCTRPIAINSVTDKEPEELFGEQNSNVRFHTPPYFDSTENTSQVTSSLATIFKSAGIPRIMLRM